METSRRMNLKVIALFTAFLVLLSAGRPHCEVGGTGSGAGGRSVILNMRVGNHHTFERLVFDIQGARPVSVGPPTEQGIRIEFGQVESRVKFETLRNRLPASVDDVTLQHGEQGSFLFIRVKDRNTTIKSSHGGNEKGLYRLVLDFTPSTTGSAPPVQPPSAGSDSDALGGKPIERPEKKRTSRASSPIASPSRQPAPLDRISPDVTSGNSWIDELFRIADDRFLAGENDLANNALEILDLYNAAMKAGPQAPQAPRAVFRSALCYLAMDDLKKAEEGFKRLIAAFPTHPTIPMAWLHLAKVQQRRKAYIESIQAFRTAMGYSLPKDELTEAYYALGKSLSSAEAHKEAIDSVRKCLDEDPTYYRKRPDMLRFLGESFFAAQQYDKSCESFFRYLNLQKEIPDRDVVLAKLAEGLLYLGEQNLANNIYNHIEKQYPDSEGDIIGKIRRAELLEQKDTKHRDAALAIYQELAEKSLSPPLARLVFFRLATWQWKQGNYEKSLSLIGQAMQIKGAPGSNDELQNLRDKVVIDWIKQAFANKEYSKVLELYREYKTQFQFWATPEFDLMAAESYGALKMHPNAVEIYQQLLTKSPKKNEEWLYQAALHSFMMKDMERAIQLALQIQSESLDAQKSELLGQIMFSQKKYKDAAQYFSRLFRDGGALESGRTDVVLAYVESLMHTDRHAETLTVLRKAAKGLDKGEVEHRVKACLLESKCYQAVKQPEKAIETLERALSLLPPGELKDQLTYQLSVLYQEGNQSSKAVEKLTQLLQSSHSLWKAAAQQQLEYIRMQGAKPGTGEN